MSQCHWSGHAHGDGERRTQTSTSTVPISAPLGGSRGEEVTDPFHSLDVEGLGGMDDEQPPMAGRPPPVLDVLDAVDEEIAPRLAQRQRLHTESLPSDPSLLC